VAFDQAAVRNSSGQSNLEGGDLGFRPIAELPEVFAKAIVTMKPGDVYGPIRAGNGIQLIKLVAIKGEQQTLTDAQIREPYLDENSMKFIPHGSEAWKIKRMFTECSNFIRRYAFGETTSTFSSLISKTIKIRPEIFTF